MVLPKGKKKKNQSDCNDLINLLFTSINAAIHQLRIEKIRKLQGEIMLQ